MSSYDVAYIFKLVESSMYGAVSDIELGEKADLVESCHFSWIGIACCQSPETLES